MTITVPIDIQDEAIRGLLCSAFEGGSNYWCIIDKVVYPAGALQKDYGEGGKRQPVKGDYWHWSQLVPLEAGGALVITSKLGDEINGAKKWRLDREAIQRGLKAMAEKARRHFGNFLAESDDATTGDVFLQLALFGEVVYG